MKEWKELFLDDVGVLQRGVSKHRPRYAFHLYNGPYPFIQTGDVKTSNKYIKKYEQTYSEEGLAQSKLWPKGSLCITIAANIAEVGILGMDACFPDSILGFIPDETKCSVDFVYYSLKHYQKLLQVFGEGSVQDNINLGTFKEITFKFPPLPEQKAIAEILSSLDDKIDLLHRNNRTLEYMAKTIYRQWFIEEAYKYDKCLFGDEFDILMGQSPPSNTYNEVGDGSIFFQGRSDFGFRFPTERVYCTSPKRIAKQFDVLLSVRAPVGDINMAMEDCCIGRGLAAIRHKKGYTSYAYYKAKSLQDEFGVFEREGTVFGAISKSDLKSIKTTMPSEKLIRKFEDIVNPIDRQIYFNTLQIRTLESLRDTLLPKLITGEIRVPL